MERSAMMKVGMVGVGGFGGVRRTWMRATGLFEIVAAYDLSKEALQHALKADGARPVESFEALLDTPDIEAVIISTGAKFHAEQIIAALDRGRHVYVEKPLCSTPEEIRAIAAAQRRTGLVVGVGHHDHSQEVSSAVVKQMIDAAELGKIVAVHATTCHSGGLKIQPGDWRGDPQKNPGGMLFQCGVHKLHEMMYYFGPIRRVGCMMRYDVNPNTRTADAAVCTLEFDSGVIGTLAAYHVTPYRHFMHIYGTAMNVYRDEHLNGAGTTVCCQRVAPKMDGSVEMAEALTFAGADDLTGGLRSFYKAVREGGKAYPDWSDGARAVSVVFAAEEAAKTGRTVEIDPF